MKTIYISDIKSRNTNGKLIGHFAPVAKNYKEVFDKVCDVKISGGPIYEKYFGKECLLVLPFDNFRDSVIGKLCTMINAIFLFFKARNQIIVLQQCGSVTTFVIIALFYWFTSKLYVIQYNTESLNTELKRMIYRMAGWKIDGFIVPNERVGAEYSKKTCVVTDYILCKNKVDWLPYKDRKWDFGFVGSIFKDKGVLPAVEYLANKGYKILVAGHIGEPEIEGPLKCVLAEHANIECKLEYIDDWSFNDYIKKCKFCVLNYQGTYFDRSSGVVLDVIFNGTPVIGKRCSALSLVDEYGMGMLYDDITELNAELVMEERVHERYLNGIGRFVNEQCKMTEKLRNFILNQ